MLPSSSASSKKLVRSSFGSARCSLIRASRYCVELAFPLEYLALLGRHVDVFEDDLDQAAEEVGVFLREAEHPHDHAHGDVLRVVDRGVEHVFAFELVEQLVAQRA